MPLPGSAPTWRNLASKSRWSSQALENGLIPTKCASSEEAVMTATPITRRATRPEECALALALPATKQAFVRDLGLGTAKDFARHTVRWDGAEPPDPKDADKWYQLYYADCVQV